jgi:hypothetical protein
MAWKNLDDKYRELLFSAEEPVLLQVLKIFLEQPREIILEESGQVIKQKLDLNNVRHREIFYSHVHAKLAFIKNRFPGKGELIQRSFGKAQEILLN